MALDLSISASSKLEPFLLLSKSARGAAAAKLVQDVTSASGVFVFAELLDVPSIHELANSEHAPYLSLLRLFAYGTFDDYLDQQKNLPPLNPAQIKKLKLLTLVSLSLQLRVLKYELLLHRLQMSNIRELEDLIIDGIYLDVIRGKLDQNKQQFEVEFALGRDLEPAKVESLLVILKEWSNTTASVLDTLDSHLAELVVKRTETKNELENHEKVLQATLSEVHEKAKENKSHRKAGLAALLSGGGDDPMDVDDPRSTQESKAKKLLKMGSSQSKKRNRF